MAPQSSSTSDPNAVKLALAIALLRFKKLNSRLSHSPSSTSDIQKWKKKAKDRKSEILRLREELKQLEDGREVEDLPQIVSCKCRFFDDCGDLDRRGGNGDDEHWIGDVLRRRFLRLVRWKERRKRLEGPLQRRHLFVFNTENEIEQFGVSIDFLVELSDKISVKGNSDASIATFSHQAIDFYFSTNCDTGFVKLYSLEASLKNLLSLQKDMELIEEIVNGLIMRLMRKMCDVPESTGYLDSDSDPQFYVQHLIRKLGNDPFIGQRIMLSTSQNISVVAESLLMMDPFNSAFPGMHGSMYMMIQLVEFLILDSLQNWASNEFFDNRLFEEWVRLIVQARKSSQVLESRNTLYVLYMERVIGELVKQVSPLAQQGMLDFNIISHLLSPHV